MGFLVGSWNGYYTPVKINMEPKHHQIEKKIHCPKLHFWFPCKFSRVYVAIHYQLFKQLFWTVVSESLGFLCVVMDFWMVSSRPIIVDVFCSYWPHSKVTF